jgi:opacity protein-like surface antigen
MKPSSNNSIDRLFAEKLKGFEAVPNQHNWMSIEASLAARSLWKYRVIKRWALFGSVALLFIGANVFMWQKTMNSGLDSFDTGWYLPDYQTVIAETDVNPDYLALPAFITNPKAIADELPEIHEPVNNEMLVVNDVKPVKDVSVDVSHEALIADYTAENLQRAYPSKVLIATGYTVESPETKGNSLITNFYIEDNQLQEARLSGVHFGPTIMAQYTWLGNKNLDRITNRYGYNAGVAGGSAYGLNVGYDFNSKLGIQADIIFSSIEGADYTYSGKNNFRAMSDVPGKLRLNYTRIPVMVKVRMSKLVQPLQTASVLSYMIGLEYGRLNWVNLDESMPYIPTENFNKQEWGLMMGMEYDIYLGKNYALTIGARGRMSTKLSDFPMILSNDFQTPHTFGIGVNARLNFVIPTRH